MTTYCISVKDGGYQSQTIASDCNMTHKLGAYGYPQISTHMYKLIIIRGDKKLIIITQQW